MPTEDDFDYDWSKFKVAVSIENMQTMMLKWHDEYPKHDKTEPIFKDLEKVETECAILLSAASHPIVPECTITEQFWDRWKDVVELFDKVKDYLESLPKNPKILKRAPSVD